mgnify:CR=1 FL=1
MYKQKRSKNENNSAKIISRKSRKFSKENGNLQKNQEKF